MVPKASRFNVKIRFDGTKEKKTKFSIDNRVSRKRRNRTSAVDETVLCAGDYSAAFKTVASAPELCD